MGWRGLSTAPCRLPPSRGISVSEENRGDRSPDVHDAVLVPDYAYPAHAGQFGQSRLRHASAFPPFLKRHRLTPLCSGETDCSKIITIAVCETLFGCQAFPADWLMVPSVAKLLQSCQIRRVRRAHATTSQPRPHLTRDAATPLAVNAAT